MLYLFLSLVFLNLFLFYGNYLFLFFIGILLVCIGKRYDFKLFCFCCLVILVFVSININFYNYEIKSEYIKDNFEIVEVKENYSYISNSKYKFVVYNNDNIFVEGNVVCFEGELIDISHSYSDFNNYLNKRGIRYELRYYSFGVVDNSVKLNNIVVDKLLENKEKISASYLKLILFNGKDDINSDVFDSFSVFSLTYLIAVSGFHINILLKFIKKIFKKDFIGYGVVVFYLYLLDFSVSSYRAFLCDVLKKINKKFEFDLSNIDIISLIGVVFLFINPSNMFSYGFVFSFLSTFVLEIFKLYTKNKVILSFYIYLVNIPLILFNYYKMNVLSLVISILFSYPVSFLYVFSIIYLFFDKFYLVYKLVVYGLKSFLDFFSGFSLELVFGKPSFIFLIVYYFLLLCFFVFKERKRKIRFVYLGFVFIALSYQYLKPMLNSYEQVYFLNVGQGDCSVFIVPNSKKAVLVDTGGNKYRDVANKEIIPFLESKGINMIEKVIISHDDFDHNGALESLKKNFDVKEVIENSLFSSVEIGNKIFINLNVSDKRDNDGSVVLYGQYAGFDLLLMGDVSSEVEESVLDDIDEVDIVKIGHHGSNSSSSDLFLSSIKGKVAIVSVGKYNMYGHPHNDVIDRLEKYGYIIFRTDYHNDIGFGKNIFGFSFIDYFK